MRTFRCRNCGHVLLFESTRCERCRRRVAYSFERADMLPLGEEDNGCRSVAGVAIEHGPVRLCANYDGEWPVCNVAVPEHDSEALCIACRLTTTIPNLSRPGHREQWRKMENAKRRALYTLRVLGLEWEDRCRNPSEGLAFELLAPVDTADHHVLTGHMDGIITVNLDEADDAERARRRQTLNEPYRTLLGHFRHEIGHYYWNRVIRDRHREAAFRAAFGDEREDYDEALRRHYADPTPPDWPLRFISAYASAHPWEDWAETWAHYMHMIDVLEIAQDAGLTLEPRQEELPRLSLESDPTPADIAFDDLTQRWHALTFTLNNLNRGMGHDDAYPFAPSLAALSKLRFVHRELAAVRAAHDEAGRVDSRVQARSAG